MNDKIKCPNCAHEFDVEEALAGKLEEQYKRQYEKKIAEQAAKFNAQKQELENAQHLFEQQKEKENERFTQRLNENLAKEIKKIEAQTKEGYEQQLNLLQEENEKKKAENKLLKEKEIKLLKKENALKEQAEELEITIQKQLLEERQKIEAKVRKKEQETMLLKENEFKKQLEASKKEVNELKKQQIELLKKENQLKEKAQEMELNIQKQLLEKQQEIEEKGRAKEREAMLLKEREYQKQLEDQKKLIDEMKRKAEQGSMQMQGEVQELALEELLAATYPFDQISEVPKGIRGADSIQTVYNKRQQVCGSIVYESKRTKNFAYDWIDKLKQDQIQCKADIAVIVTATFPTGMDRFGQKDGVWICGFHEVKSVSFVLRELLLQTAAIASSEENKGDKMELLYNYFTSNEFVQNINRIMENYDNMNQLLNKEKRSMQAMWKQREKQIEAVQVNFASLFGSIRGIAGNELPHSSIFELPFDEENE